MLNKENKEAKLEHWRILTKMALAVINSTEQWVRATKSALTPNVPPHRVSPTTTLAPIESLQSTSKQRKLNELEHVLSNFQIGKIRKTKKNSHSIWFFWFCKVDQSGVWRKKKGMSFDYTRAQKHKEGSCHLPLQPVGIHAQPRISR